jgi:hypothetical protein
MLLPKRACPHEDINDLKIREGRRAFLALGGDPLSFARFASTT